MTEYYQIPRLVLLKIIYIKWGIAKHRHLDFKQKWKHKIKYPKRYSPLEGIDVCDIVKCFTIVLRRNPFWMFPISHRRIEYWYFVILFLNVFVARIKWSFANNLDLIKLKVNSQEPKQSNADGLEYLQLKVISCSHKEEDRRIWPSSFVDVANDWDEDNNHPEILLMVRLHDDDAFEVEEEEEYLFEGENIFLHKLLSNTIQWYEFVILIS